MKKKANELIFISQINRDGSGTTPICPELKSTESFKIHKLSLIGKTYIAMGFNSFVVKLREEKEKPKSGLYCTNCFDEKEYCNCFHPNWINKIQD